MASKDECECGMAKATGKRCYPQCEPSGMSAALVDSLNYALASMDVEMNYLRSQYATCLPDSAESQKWAHKIRVCTNAIETVESIMPTAIG